ncbi:MAG: glycosyltransferase family 39 protein [Edaphobacter sp.]
MKSTGARLSLIVLAALAVRLLLVACVFHQTVSPNHHFSEFGWEVGWVARSIALGHGFSSPFNPSTGPTALVPPIFPYLLAAVFRLFGLYTAASAIVVLSINSLFSALTCIPLYFSAKETLGSKAAVLAAWIWAFYPFAIYFSAARVWDYALTGLLFTICFWAAQRLRRQQHTLFWLGFGVLYGITALSNPSVLSMFPVFLLLAILSLRQRQEKWLGHTLVAVLGLIAILTPWTIRNYRTLHVLTPIRDNFWLEAWAGNSGNTFESNDRWAHPASSPLEMQKFKSVGETRYLAGKRTLVLHFVDQHPILFIKSSFHRVFSFWTGYWSFNPAYLQDEPTEIPDIFFSTGLTFFMLYGLRNLWRRDKTAALPYLTLIAFFPVTYYLTHTSPDYRQPIEPEIVALISIGLLSFREFGKMFFGKDQQEQYSEDDRSLTVSSST